MRPTLPAQRRHSSQSSTLHCSFTKADVGALCSIEDFRKTQLRDTADFRFLNFADAA